MIDEMLTFLARAPTLGDLSLTWGQAGPRLGTGGMYLRGVKVLQTKTDLLGCQKQRCRAEFLLRLCLPLPAGDTDTALQNARRLLGDSPKYRRLLDYTASPRDIADPWYTGDFETTYREILEGCLALLDALEG